MKHRASPNANSTSSLNHDSTKRNHTTIEVEGRKKINSSVALLALNGLELMRNIRSKLKHISAGKLKIATLLSYNKTVLEKCPASAAESKNNPLPDLRDLWLFRRRQEPSWRWCLRSVVESGFVGVLIRTLLLLHCIILLVLCQSSFVRNGRRTQNNHKVESQTGMNELRQVIQTAE